MVGPKESADLHEITAAFAAVPLLAGLDPTTLDHLAQAAECVPVRAGGIVVHAGEPGDAFYVVRSGLLEVLTEGDRVRVRLLRAGTPFGELALLSGRPRNATVRAVRDSEVWRLSRATFDAALEVDARFARAMVHVLTRLVFESGPQTQLDSASHSTYAVMALHEGAPVAALANAFAAAVGPGRMHTVHERPDREPGTWGRFVEALEQDHDFVLLVAPRPADEWAEFCRREADRTVGVAEAGASIAPVGFAKGVELALVGTPRPGEVRRALTVVDPRALHLVETGEPATLARAARRITARSVGIVLSGGGARGLAHIGVIEVLAGSGLTIDRYGGTSMGALVGALASRGVAARDLARLMRAELVDGRPFSDYGIPRVSLIRAKRARAMLDRLLGAGAIEELPHDFFCISADLITAQPVVHRRGSLVDAVGASMSLPGLAPPMRDGERLLVDGGVLDNLPVEAMIATDEGPVIAVDVLARGIPGSKRQARFTRDPMLPTLVETLARSATLSSRSRADASRELAACAIVPDLRDIGLLDFVRFDEIVAAGRRAAEETLRNGPILPESV